MMYSPLDAVTLAQREPQRQVIFFAVGFETTAPTTALAVLQAERLGLTNFSLLVAQVRVLPAMELVEAGIRQPCARFSRCRSRLHGDGSYFLWHIEILPRLTAPAGFELGSGMSINTVLSEKAAAYLRGVDASWRTLWASPQKRRSHRSA